jgi:hypothetical protein
MLALREAKVTPPDSDVIQALLRVSLDGAADALSAARSIDEPMARTLRFALGDPDVVPDASVAPKTWWVAAARAQWPRDDLSTRLSDLGVNLDWPDVIRPARYEWGIREQTSKHYGKTHTRSFVAITVDPPLSGVSDEHPPELNLLVRPVNESVLGQAGRLLRRAAHGIGRGARLAGQRVRTGHLDLGIAFPTALHHQSGGAWWKNFGTQTPWMVGWQASLWPHNLDGFYVRGVRAMADRIDMNSSTMDPTHAYLEPMFEPGRPWTQMTILALMVGSASKESDCRRLASDALIEGIEDGRAHPAPIAQVIDGLAQNNWLKLNRLAESLSEVARVSPLHQLVIAEVLESFVATRDEFPRSIHHLLELLNELLVALDRSVRSPLRERLERVKGASKSAKLCKVLLARSNTGMGRGEREAIVQALRTRVERAKGAVR